MKSWAHLARLYRCSWSSQRQFLKASWFISHNVHNQLTTHVRQWTTLILFLGGGRGKYQWTRSKISSIKYSLQNYLCQISRMEDVIAHVPVINFQIGEKIPPVELYPEDTPTKPLNAQELFKGKKGVLFAVVGAFTPGCSQVGARVLLLLLSLPADA